MTSFHVSQYPVFVKQAPSHKPRALHPNTWCHLKALTYNTFSIVQDNTFITVHNKTIARVSESISFTVDAQEHRKEPFPASPWHRVYTNPTFPTMSRCPWLAARCSGVSSPRFMTLMRAPLMMSMSTTLERPSLHAQWRGLKPWSSLQWQRSIHI